MSLRRRVGKLGEAAARAMIDRHPRIAFIHIPKCAGSSVCESLYEAIYPAPLAALRFYRKIDLSASRSAAELLGMDAATCSQAVLIHALSDPMARFVTGHVRAHPDVVERFSEWKFVTVLREPTARFISAYVFHRYNRSLAAKVDCDFTDFLETERARFAGRIATLYFSGMSEHEVEASPEAAIAAAIQNLERFFSVGFVEDLQNWAMTIGHALGCKVRVPRTNASPKPDVWAELERSAELRRRVEALCEVDRRLYAAAEMRFKETARRVPTANDPPVIKPQPIMPQLRS